MTAISLDKSDFSVDNDTIVQMRSIAKPIKFESFVDTCREFNKKYLSTPGYIACNNFAFDYGHASSNIAHIVKDVQLKKVNGKLSLVLRLWESTDLFGNEREPMSFREIYYKIQELVSKSNDFVDSGMNVYTSHGFFGKKTMIMDTSTFAASCCNINPDRLIRIPK